MKYTLMILLAIFCFCTGFESFHKHGFSASRSTDTLQYGNNNDTMVNKLKIKVGSTTFTATLFNNETATAFKTMLPLTVNMTELNGNEKYFRLSTDLPANASNPKTIHAGDLMLWSSNTLVVFYKTFSTSYSYTNLGRIDDSSGLAVAVGPGNITLTFEL